MIACRNVSYAKRTMSYAVSASVHSALIAMLLLLPLLVLFVFICARIGWFHPFIHVTSLSHSDFFSLMNVNSFRHHCVFFSFLVHFLRQNCVFFSAVLFFYSNVSVQSAKAELRHWSHRRLKDVFIALSFLLRTKYFNHMPHGESTCLRATWWMKKRII